MPKGNAFMRTSAERFEHMAEKHRQMADACELWLAKIAMKDQLQLFVPETTAKIIPFPVAPHEEPKPPRGRGYAG